MNVRMRTPRKNSFFLVLFPLLFGLMFFGGSYLVSTEPTVEIQQDIGFATVNGRELALVPYERTGSRGMFQLMTQDMFQVRLAATDTKTGKRLWDTQISDKLSWKVAVLGTGSDTVYIATDAGLRIHSLADGSLLAAGANIEGLGKSYIATRAAYGFDAHRRVVVAMDESGRILSIPVDSVVAAPADAATTDAWSGKLTSARTPPPSMGSTSSNGQLTATETLVVKENTVGAPGERLFRSGPGSRTSPVGTSLFHGARIVLDVATPAPGIAGRLGIPNSSRAVAGTQSGHVLVHHQRNVNDRTKLISVVSLSTGEITESFPTGISQPLARSISGGRTAVIDGSTLAIVGTDGRATQIVVGAAGFFG